MINKRKIMQERYQVRGVDQQPTPPDEPKPPKTPRPKKEKQFLTEEEWQIFIKEYQKKGPDDSSVYKAKEKFLKTPRKYKHSVSNEERDVWDDILSSLPKWKVSRKWVNGYIHNASCLSKIIIALLPALLAPSANCSIISVGSSS